MQGEECYLAARVPLEETEKAIEKADERGIYDDKRSIVRSAENHTEVPITEPLPGYRSVTQNEVKQRKKELSTLVDIEDPPSSWKIIGDIVTVDLDGYNEIQKTEIAKALIELHSNCGTVIDVEDISGEMREPKIEVIYGSGETETIHRENGYIFELDLDKVMFSVGNQRERRRMQSNACKDELVFDMFAGIGYFSIPIAKGGADVIATEVNPEAYHYLKKNIKHNQVDVYPYRADCREITADVDRVVMGHFSADQYINHAINCIDSGVIHLHHRTKRNALEKELKEIEEEVNNQGYSIRNIETKRVKQLSPKYIHWVSDIEIF